MTDPIHAQCGYEVGDSGDSHVTTAAPRPCLQCKTTLTTEVYCPECTRALYAVNAVFAGEP